MNLKIKISLALFSLLFFISCNILRDEFQHYSYRENIEIFLAIIFSFIIWFIFLINKSLSSERKFKPCNLFLAFSTFIYGFSGIFFINNPLEFYYSIFEIYLFTSATFIFINKTDYKDIFKGNPFLWFPKVLYDIVIIINIILRNDTNFHTNLIDHELDKTTKELKKLIVSQVDKKETRFADYLIGNKRDKISYLRRGEKKTSFAIPKSVLERYKKISSEIEEQRNIVQSKTENHDESASEIEKLKFNPELIEIETISGTFKKFDKEEKPIFNFVIKKNSKISDIDKEKINKLFPNLIKINEEIKWLMHYCASHLAQYTSFEDMGINIREEVYAFKLVSLDEEDKKKHSDEYIKKAFKKHPFYEVHKSMIESRHKIIDISKLISVMIECFSSIKIINKLKYETHNESIPNTFFPSIGEKYFSIRENNWINFKRLIKKYCGEITDMLEEKLKLLATLAQDLKEDAQVAFDREVVLREAKEKIQELKKLSGELNNKQQEAIESFDSFKNKVEEMTANYDQHEILIKDHLEWCDMVIAGNKEIKESIIHGEETTSEVNKMISSLTDSLKGAFDVKNSQ